jgi:hypothetical protein
MFLKLKVLIEVDEGGNQLEGDFNKIARKKYLPQASTIDDCESPTDKLPNIPFL